MQLLKLAIGYLSAGSKLWERPEATRERCGELQALQRLTSPTASHER
ncbi:MAG: hypothetical protein ACPG4S_02630 [Schleiferiaceae bacterium]